jgi:hypothetical protein
MKKQTPPYWFKRYGWVWMPVRWQAWLSLLGYLCVMAVNILILSSARGEDIGMQVSLFCLVLLTSSATLGWAVYNHAPLARWHQTKKPDSPPGEDS